MMPNGSLWDSESLRVWESGSLGVWESGSLGVWECGSLGLWESGSLGVWESGSLGVWEQEYGRWYPGPQNRHFVIKGIVAKSSFGTTAGVQFWGLAPMMWGGHSESI